MSSMCDLRVLSGARDVASMISLKFVANPQIRDPTSSSTAKPVVAPSCRDGSAGQPPLDLGEPRGAAEALYQGRVNVALRGPSGGVSLDPAAEQANDYRPYQLCFHSGRRGRASRLWGVTALIHSMPPPQRNSIAPARGLRET